MHGALNAARLLWHSQFIRKDPFFSDTETILKKTCIYQETKLWVCTATVKKQVWKLQIFEPRPLSWLHHKQMIPCKLRNLASLGRGGEGGKGGGRK